MSIFKYLGAILTICLTSSFVLAQEVSTSSTSTTSQSVETIINKVADEQKATTTEKTLSTVAEKVSTTTSSATTTATSTVAVEEDEEVDEIDEVDDSKDSDALKNFESVVRQSTDYNCGPAALATLLSQLNYPTSEAQVTELYAANKEKGIDLLSLKKASIQIGKNFGFETFLKKMTLEEVATFLSKTGDPVLVHDVKKGVGGHYSVIREIKNRTVYISDTEAGNIEMSLEDYSHAFDGYVLIATENGDPKDYKDVSDEEAATVWGKYVPVYIAADSVLTGGSNAVAKFKTCINNAVTISSVIYRNTARAICYTNLAADLARDMGVIGNTKVIAQVEASKLSDKVDNYQEEDDSIGSSVRKLQNELKTLQNELANVLNLKAIVPVTLSNQLSLAKVNETTYQNSLNSKNSTLNMLNSQLSSIAITLGSLAQQISAKTSSIASISASASRQPTSYDNLVNSYASQITIAQNNINYWQSQLNNANASKSYFYNQYYYVKGGKTTSNWNNYIAWSNNVTSYTNNLNSARNSLSSAQGNYNYYKQLQTNAQTAAAGAQAKQAQVELTSLRNQEQSKQAEQTRIQGEKSKLQVDISDLNTKLSTTKNTINTLNTQISTLHTNLQNTERARLNNLISTKQKEITDEQNFIDQQEAMLQQSVKNDLKGDVTNAVVNTQKTTVSGTLYIGGTAYQIVDGVLYNSLSSAMLLAGYDINQVNNYPFQLGRQTGNNTVIAMSVVAVAGGTGAATGGTAAAVSTTAVCAATLGGGGVVLIPCGIVDTGALTVTAAGTAVAVYGAGAYTLSSANSGNIQKAVEGAKAGNATTKVVNDVKYSNTPAEAGLKGTVDLKTNLSKYITPEAKIAVDNQQLQNSYINQLYRGVEFTLRKGDGGVADAVRYEVQTGKLLSPQGHTQKAIEQLNGLRNWLSNNSTATLKDKEIVNLIINDLVNALKNL